MKLIELPLHSAVGRFFDESEKNGFERREGQIEMSREITQAIIDNRSLVVEAEVGIGKSLAYLVPFVLQFFRERRQIIIATSTISLQEQLERDIKTVLEMIGVKTRIEVAKGMKNYICLKRLCSLSNEGKEFNNLFEVAKHGVQDKNKMNVLDKLWDKICIGSFGERCADCSFRRRCEYLQMRERLRTHDEIIICNQNMLVSHLVNQEYGNGIFKSDLSAIVVDEAHNLEGKFRDAFTTSFNCNEMRSEILGVTANKKKELSSVIAEIITMLDTFFKYLHHDMYRQKKGSDGDMRTFYYRPNKGIKRLLLQIRSDMAEIERRMNRKLRSLQMLRDSESKNYIVWLTNEKGIRINVCKKDISKDIGRLLFVNGRRTILTSATISDKEDGTPEERCKYFMKSIGCPEDVRVSEPKESPFDYEHNTMLYISNKLPYPNKRNRNKYRSAAIPEIVRLLNVTLGKTLILFTAKKDMYYVFKKLSNMGLPYKIMIQSNNSSQEHRLEKFRDNVDSVILGTGTYWEGINIEGESLSQVIIFKLPFPVHDPITEYKMSLTEHPLMEVAVPEMIIKLKQGVGRLIRSENDKGIVSILDPRASSKSKTQYRETLLNALPEKNIIEDISELKRFRKNILEVSKNE